MLELYDFKIVQSGKEIEVYDYKTKKVIRGFTRPPREKNKPVITQSEWEEIVAIWGDDEEKEKLLQEQNQKTRSSIARTRTNIRRLVNANPHLNQFLTLTFSYPMTDIAEANKIFNAAIKRIMRAHPYFQYIAVIEFQKDTDFYGKKKEHGGSVHYHLLCNLGPKDTSREQVYKWEQKFAVKYWRQGFVKVKEVEQVTNLGVYLCKYLGKDMFDKRMFNKKKFFCSRSLNRPVELTGEKAKEFYEKHLQTLDPVFEKSFKSEWVGEVDYKAFTLSAEQDSDSTDPLGVNQHDQ